MMNLLLYAAISIIYYGSEAATNNATIGGLANKIQNAATVAQSSIAKLGTEANSNDSDANLHLYDLMVDSVTTNDTKIKLSSKASKTPSMFPIMTVVTATEANDDDGSVDDNTFQNVWNDTDSTFFDAEETPVLLETIKLETETPVPSPLLSDMSSGVYVPTDTTKTSRPTSNNVTASTGAPSIGTATLTPTTDINSLDIAETSDAFLPTSARNSSSDAENYRIPSLSPSLLNTLAPNKSKSPKAPTAASLIDCPEQFNSSIEYHEFDLVTMGSIMYECKEWPKDIYCNSFEPGANYSSHGWIVLGPCFPSHTQPPALGEIILPPNSISPTQSPTKDSSTTNISAMIDETPVPSKSHSSMSLATSTEENLHVNLPRIICDISLSPQLAPHFEKKHVLLVAMTNTILNTLSVNLDEALHEMVGVSLGVHVTLYKNEDDTAAKIRLKADFSGTVSFSIGALTERDLVNVLLRHFSTDEFTRHLMSRMKTIRAIQDPDVIVNSVFFSPQDGMLLRANIADEYSGASTTIKSETKPEGDNLQLAVGIFALTAVGFGLAMVLFVAHSKNIEWEEGETTDPDPVSSNNQAGNCTPTKTKSGQPDPKILISTRKKYPYFKGIDSISDISSLSASPYTERTVNVQDIAPSTPGLGIGIAAPTHRYFAGNQTPYTHDASMRYDHKIEIRSCMLETP